MFELHVNNKGSIMGRKRFGNIILQNKYILSFRMIIIKLDHCDICSSFELCHVTESFVALEAIVKTSKEDCEAINFKAKIPEKMRKP